MSLEIGTGCGSQGKFGAIGYEVEGELQVSGLWIGGCIFGF